MFLKFCMNLTNDYTYLRMTYANAQIQKIMAFILAGDLQTGRISFNSYNNQLEVADYKMNH